MINIFTSTNFLLLVLFYALSVLTFLLFGKRSFDRILREIVSNNKKLSEQIRYALAPNSVELSIEMNALIDLAIEVWRIEQRLAKSAAAIPDNQKQSLDHSVQKLKRYLGKFDLEVVDHTNQKYNEGLTLEVLAVEKDPSLAESIIKETKEPTVMCKGQVVRKAKIILLSNH